MTDTGSSRPITDSEKSTHGESHTSMSERKSQAMSRVDSSAASPQVRKSQRSEPKSHAPLPREVTFSALSLRRAERDPERGEINKNPTPPAEPEPVGAIAERVLTDLAHGRDPHLAARQHEALNRLTRAHHKEPKP